jgi:hypothetical protein
MWGVVFAMQLKIKVDEWCLLWNAKNDDLDENRIFEVRIWRDQNLTNSGETM